MSGYRTLSVFNMAVSLLMTDWVPPPLTDMLLIALCLILVLRERQSFLSLSAFFSP